jgi:acyl-CoA dehydrogenase-like protein
MNATHDTASGSGQSVLAGASPAGNGRSVVEPPVLGGPEHSDYYLLGDLLTDEQRALRQKVRDFMDREVTPIINPYWERAEFPHELVPKLAQLGIAGFQIPGYGCPGMTNVTTGVVILELARGDLSISTFTGVHSALAMASIALLGSEEQKQRFLPPMARLEKIGARVAGLVSGLDPPEQRGERLVQATQRRCLLAGERPAALTFRVERPDVLQLRRLVPVADAGFRHMPVGGPAFLQRPVIERAVIPKHLRHCLRLLGRRAEEELIRAAHSAPPFAFFAQGRSHRVSM